jgi:murein L,D-transpeptidase YafK
MTETAPTATKADPPRVADARARIGADVKAAVERLGVAYPPQEVFLRAFKEEQRLEVWVGDGAHPLQRLEDLAVCASSGALGPKHKQGDLQVPEGVYAIDSENPASTYHLALHVDYPNRADRIAGKALGIADLGGAIMVHGNCVTIGCIPLEDGPIERVYLVVHDARARGAHVAIHIFPTKLDAAGLAAVQARTDDPALRSFWASLAPIYAAFQDTKRVPHVDVDAKGAYRLRAP